MCGIAGVLSYGDFRVSEAVLKRMCDSISHRGPDGEGFWVGDGGRIGLGHRRLSIIDLSTAANQPMSTPDSLIWVVFNGEIYNHAEIRRELEALGDRTWLTDHSDTEVLLHAYQRWGIEALHRFRGMFAFGLWDGRTKELYLVRDRIGMKPLYYTRYGRRVAFASEIKALLTDRQLDRSVNEEAMYHYLSFMTAPAPSTMFKGIYKLPPGTWLKINANGEEEQRQYWDVLDHVNPITNASEDEVTERIIAELRDAVRYRKVSDVPVGVFLSGGIDSSTNAALFQEGESTAVRTFSVGYTGEYASYKNEFDLARQVARQIGADHYELSLTQDDLLNLHSKVVWLNDEPNADTVGAPIYQLSKMARDHGVIVYMVGEGADELFCGYPRWRALLNLEETMSHWTIPNGAKRLGLSLLSGLAMDTDTMYEWLRRNTLGQPVFWGTADAYKDVAKKQLVSRRLRAALGDRTSWEVVEPIRRRFEEKAWEKSNLNWMTYMELNMRLPELLLMRADKMSMGASEETRVPFLDHKFVELAMSIPSEMKLRGNTTKYLLKKAVRGIIPDNIIDRPKQPFNMPIIEWFFDRLGATAHEQINDFCRNTDLIDSNEVERLFRQRKGSHLWLLLNLAMWWRTFISGEGVPNEATGTPLQKGLVGVG